MNRNYKLVSELLFTGNVKESRGDIYITEGKNLTRLSEKGNIQDTLFMFLPYEKDTYIILHISMQDEKWKFIELDTPLETTVEELQEILENKQKINNIEKIFGTVTYVMDKEHLPKEITIRLSSPSKHIAKNILILQKKAFYYGYFLSPNKDWKYDKKSEEDLKKD